MTVRPATPVDVPRLVAMGQAFREASVYRGFLADNPAQVARLYDQLMGGGGTILVLDTGTAVVGMIGLYCAPHFLSGERFAGEVVWWIDPPFRGHGLKLLRAAEAWAQAQGAVTFQMMAPDARTETLYERLGYHVLERTYYRRFDPPEIRVFDDVLPDVAAYRAACLAQAFRSVNVGITFHGIAQAPSADLENWWVAHLPAVDAPTLTFVRKSPAGQSEPNYIHTDRDMGSWTGILYLTAHPAPGDGTTFWRDRQTGATASTSTDPLEARTWQDLDRWEPVQTVPARPGRLVVFPAARYHSRALVENYGETPETARLVQVLFAGPATKRGGVTA